ncbi:hypothetical protein KFZ70_07260 [Tamlana fucoidanivorans]|uniref:Uncharacterized protein n=1 Tax=Allotamlana fucoidanivorans TaxID=2583814 RepID=A0A5C4SP74_9FLAO|nr:hypothetical protein [Tamlana fucoidanivorans]TNJ45194.1 hypothetical protein FGF67_05655 [Tamlana fucoidanivorans]
MKKMFKTGVSLLVVLVLTSTTLSANNKFDKPESKVLPVSDIKVYELDEEVNLGFDTTAYLPSEFNYFEGLNQHEINQAANAILFDWEDMSTHALEVDDIEVYEVEEVSELEFDTLEYLPADFNYFEGLSKDEELEIEGSLIYEMVFGEDPIATVEEVEQIGFYRAKHSM